MNDSSIILVPISIGELFDKITILQIKKNRIKGNKLDNVNKELNHLEEVVKNNNLKIEKKFFTQLKKIITNTEKILEIYLKYLILKIIL